MNGLYGLSAIAIALAMGHVVHALLSGLPASLYGMIIFAALLHFGFVKATKVSAIINWLLRNIGVFFVPAGVGIIEHFELIKHYGVLLVLIIFLTTFFLLSLVGLTFQHLENRQQQLDNKE